MKYTINEFRAQYDTDEKCLDAVFKMRYKKMPCCPQCHQATTFKRIPNRRCYQCSDKDCQYQLYPTVGTVFERTRTSLKDWFYAIYLMTSTRNGVAAKELERQLGVTYKTAWRMGHQIRLLMAEVGVQGLLSGTIEADEVYIGGQHKNKHKKKRNELNEKGTGSINKVPIFTMLERNGAVRGVVLDKAMGETIRPIIAANIKAGSKLVTDGFGGYYGLDKMYKHTIVNHEKDEFVKGNKHTNSIEGFFSHLKRSIKGTHIQVSKKHLQKYVNEAAFKYSYRLRGQGMFFTILNFVA